MYVMCIPCNKYEKYRQAKEEGISPKAPVEAPAVTLVRVWVTCAQRVCMQSMCCAPAHVWKPRVPGGHSAVC